MPDNISMKYDTDLNAFIVRMPAEIFFDQLRDWRKQVFISLESGSVPDKFSILLDTNLHRFESIDCLRLIRHLLSNEIIHRIAFAAFVKPANVPVPESEHPQERYFDDYESAYAWLESKTRFEQPEN